MGYLYEEEKVDKHRAAEALATVILLSIMFLGLSSLYSHYSLILPVMLSFAYYMLVLSQSIRDYVSRKWVRVTIMALVIASVSITTSQILNEHIVPSLYIGRLVLILLLLSVLLIVLFLRIKE